MRAVLGLGRSLQIPVLAEGVETDDQLAFLAQEGCHQAQGYLFGRPGPLTDLGQPSAASREAGARRLTAHAGMRCQSRIWLRNHVSWRLA